MALRKRAPRCPSLARWSAASVADMVVAIRMPPSTAQTFCVGQTTLPLRRALITVTKSSGAVAEQREHPVSLVDAQRAKHVREAAGQPTQLGVRQVARRHGTVPGRRGDEAQRGARGDRAVDMPVDRGKGDVAAVACHPRAGVGDRRPGKLRAGAVVVRQIRRDTKILGRLRDCGHGGSTPLRKAGPTFAMTRSSRSS